MQGLMKKFSGKPYLQEKEPWGFPGQETRSLHIFFGFSKIFPGLLHIRVQLFRILRVGVKGRMV